MKLQTIIDIEPFASQIDYRDGVVALGSCFAQRIGGAMERAKFRIVTNPTGVLFNPMSILATVERLVAGRMVEVDELHEGDQGWFHFDMHSSLSGATPRQALERINSAIERGGAALAESRWVVVTLGTAWVYELAESAGDGGGRVVANCHKQPSQMFARRRLSVDEVCAAIGRIAELLPGREIILTLSPIRHLADGACDNAVSKATLRLAIDEMVGKSKNIHYFPAYEIVLDELRDYRFYDRDMVHPSDVAVEYIWERFCEVALSATSRATMGRVLRVVEASEHRPFRPDSEAYARFCRAQLRAIEQLDGVEFGKEYEYFCRNLKNNL